MPRALLTLVAVGLAAPAGAQVRTVTCSSDDGAYHSCSVESGSRVRLLRQLSGSPCREGETWGFDSNRIWVDRGCRAEFEVQASPSAIGGGTILRCSSDDGRRHLCPTDTRGGVRLARQISGSPCNEGTSWGYDGSGVWVDRGCRAEFEVLASQSFSAGGTILRCSSDDGRRHLCPADTRGGVRLARQISGSPCNEGTSWGFDRAGVWVDRGCRAEFEILAPQPSYRSGNTIRCASDDGRRHVCPAETEGGVLLVRQLGGTRCQQGYSWGYDRDGIWVDHGCGGDFQVRPGRGSGSFRRQPQAAVVVCASDDGRRRVCPADTRRGVRMVRQISGSPCRMGDTWGFDGSGIWVDRGCRAEFETGYRATGPFNR